MGKIIALGGGEIGRPGYPVETTKIDKETIKLTGKKSPKFLFLPTASSDDKGYTTVIEKHFGKRLGCKVDALYLINTRLTKNEIEEKIIQSDIVYVGGGNTLKMLKIWKKFGVDKVLKKAHDKGIILSGVSAGSMCWFASGISDSRKMTNPNADYIKIKSLGFIPALHCPHYDSEKDRRPQLKKMMKKTVGVAIAIENCCAIEVVDGKYKIIDSKKNANAYKVYWKNGKFFEEKIVKKTWTPLAELLRK